MTSRSVVRFSHDGFTVSGTSTGSVSCRSSSVVRVVVRVTEPLATASTSTLALVWPCAGTVTTAGSPTWTRGRSEVTVTFTVIGVSMPLVIVMGTAAVSETTL